MCVTVTRRWRNTGLGVNFETQLKPLNFFHNANRAIFEIILMIKNIFFMENSITNRSLIFKTNLILLLMTPAPALDRYYVFSPDFKLLSVIVISVKK